MKKVLGLATVAVLSLGVVCASAEVASSGYNIRKVQSIDVFGRVCTDTYAVAGTASDCDYPPVERRD